MKFEVKDSNAENPIEVQSFTTIEEDEESRIRRFIITHWTWIFAILLVITLMLSYLTDDESMFTLVYDRMEPLIYLVAGYYFRYSSTHT